MKIVGMDGLQPQQIAEELQRGAKFVVYQYCISIVVMTFKRRSNVHYIRPGESRIGKGMGYTVLSLVAGWWGIPWGPIYTIGSLVTNFGGGQDVTAEIAAGMFPPTPAVPMYQQPAWPQPVAAAPAQPVAWPQPTGAAPEQPVETPPNYYSGPSR